MEFKITNFNDKNIINELYNLICISINKGIKLDINLNAKNLNNKDLNKINEIKSLLEQNTIININSDIISNNDTKLDDFDNLLENKINNMENINYNLRLFSEVEDEDISEKYALSTFYNINDLIN